MTVFQPRGCGDEFDRLLADARASQRYLDTICVQMPCRCGAPGCRQVITSNDWQLPRWRDQYQGHVVPAVARHIAAQH